MRALERWQCFSKNSHCDLDLGPRTLKLKFVQDIVILNIDLGPRTLKLELVQDIVILNICVK